MKKQVLICDPCAAAGKLKPATGYYTTEDKRTFDACASCLRVAAEIKEFAIFNYKFIGGTQLKE